VYYISKKSYVNRCLYFCTFSFGHYVVCSSWIYIFWLTLWYFQTLLKLFHLYTMSLVKSLYLSTQSLVKLLYFSTKSSVKSLYLSTKSLVILLYLSTMSLVKLPYLSTKGLIRICISKKNRQRNDQKKKYKSTNNDLRKTF
jgi:hypothetical protein